MSGPEYPLLVVPSSEMYQLAHIATFIAAGIARHRRAGRGRDGRGQRADAVRDIAGARVALDRACGVSTPTPTGDLPQPLDAGTFNTARGLLADGPRWAEVVPLATVGGQGWAVIGHVPGLGPVGIRVTSQPLAEALREHVLTQPATELAPWVVTDRTGKAPSVPEQVDLAAFVESLDPAQPGSRAVARHLRGLDRRTDAAIRGRFAGVDLDAPLVVEPPATRAVLPTPPPRAAPGSRAAADSRGPGRQPPTTRPPSVPTTSAGP